jgi:hypothetical protein
MKMSDLIVNSKEGINQLKEIQFGVFSSTEIAKLSTIECVNSNYLMMILNTQFLTVHMILVWG